MRGKIKLFFWLAVGIEYVYLFRDYTCGTITVFINVSRFAYIAIVIVIRSQRSLKKTEVIKYVNNKQSKLLTCKVKPPSFEDID